MTVKSGNIPPLLPRAQGPEDHVRNYHPLGEHTDKLFHDALTMTLSLDGMITFLSDSAQALFHILPEQDAFGLLMHPDYDEMAANGVAWMEFSRLQLRTISGDYQWFAIKTMRDDQHIMLLLEPIDAILRMEQDLYDAKQQLANAMAEREAFLRQINHEVRTPLNAILGFSELMERTRSDKDGDKEYLQHIRLSSQHLLGKLGDMIDLSANSTNPPRLQSDDIKSHILLHSTLVNLQQNVSAAGVKIYQQPDLPRVTLTCDVKLMCRAIGHAIQATLARLSQGNIIRVGACIDMHGDFCITIEDDGLPLSNDRRNLLQHVASNSEGYYHHTDMYVQDDMSYILAMETLHRHEGSFDIRTLSRHGTIVTLTLPATRVAMDSNYQI